jgi:hypothetical protein
MAVALSALTPVNEGPIAFIRTAPAAHGMATPQEGPVACPTLDGQDGRGLGCLPGQATSFNYLQPMSLLTGTNYVISLRASAGAPNFDAAPFSGSGTALVDPYFSLDASVPDPGDYTLLFSPGIINSPDNVAVPELSTWAMMLLGFAGLGIAGYRVRRNSAVVA